MLSSKALKDLVAEARPIIERQLDDAERIAAFRDVVASSGGDWSALKALIKAQIQDERDEAGDGKRVKKILEKAGFSTGYADMLGWSNMNEKNFSDDDDYDLETGEILDNNRASDGSPSVSSSPAESEAEEISASYSEMDRATEGSFETGSEAAEKGRKATATVAAPADLSHAGAGESPAADERSVEATGGAALVRTIPAGSSSGKASDFGSEDAGSIPAPASSSDQPGEGGTDEVTSIAPRERETVTSNTGEGEASAALPAKPKVSYRPNCLHPENCASGTRDHCWSCRRAMAQSEVAA